MCVVVGLVMSCRVVWLLCVFCVFVVRSIPEDWWVCAGGTSMVIDHRWEQVQVVLYCYFRVSREG